MRRPGWSPWLLLAPSLAILVGVFVIPLGILGRYSFYRTGAGGVMMPAWALDQYARFLLDAHYLRILGITLALAFGVTLVTAVLGYPLAYGLARARSPRRRALGVTALLIPLMTSVVVRSYGWMILLASTGVVNASLVATGIVSRPIQLLFTPTGVVIALAEVLLPFMVLSLLPVLQGVDVALEEASHSLGASPMATFRHIILPLSLPGLVSGSVLVFVLSVGAFATPRLVGGPTTDVITVLIYEQTLSLLNWPFGAASAWVLLLLVLALIWAQGYVVRRHATGLAGAP
jgi:putative spermidine/putrescine transport system permease protein